MEQQISIRNNLFKVKETGEAKCHVCTKDITGLAQFTSVECKHIVCLKCIPMSLPEVQTHRQMNKYHCNGQWWTSRIAKDKGSAEISGLCPVCSLVNAWNSPNNPHSKSRMLIKK